MFPYSELSSPPVFSQTAAASHSFCPQITHWSLNEVDAGLEVQAKVNEVPFNAFSLVFFLLQHEHGVVEKLLQFLIGVVDTELFKRIQLGRGERKALAGE